MKLREESLTRSAQILLFFNYLVLHLHCTVALMLTDPAFCDSGSFNAYQGSWDYPSRLLDADVILKLQDTIPSICDNWLQGTLANILNSLFLVSNTVSHVLPSWFKLSIPRLNSSCSCWYTWALSYSSFSEHFFASHTGESLPPLVTLVAGLGAMRRGRSWEAQAHLVDCPSQESLVHGLQMSQTESCPLKTRLEP